MIGRIILDMYAAGLLGSIQCRVFEWMSTSYKRGLLVNSVVPEAGGGFQLHTIQPQCCVMKAESKFPAEAAVLDTVNICAMLSNFLRVTCIAR